MASVGLEEALTINASANEIIGTQGNRLSGGLGGRRFSPEQPVAEVAEEDPGPRLQLAQQYRSLVHRSITLGLNCCTF